MTEGNGASAARDTAAYWDTVAPHHWRLEDNYLNVPSVRLILGDIRPPVMVVGSGQGLIVEELRRQGLRCDGIDLSAEMMEYARLRRGLTLVRANATAMPFADGTYETVIVATGVIDFMADVRQIETVVREANRIVSGTGNVFVAFYRYSAAQQRFLTSLGLLRDGTLHMRSAMVLSRLGFGALVAWVAKTAGISTFQAVLLCISTALGSTQRERAVGLAIRRVLAQAGDPDAFYPRSTHNRFLVANRSVGAIMSASGFLLRNLPHSVSIATIRLPPRRGQETVPQPLHEIVV